jgi:hypothetical protein
MISLFVGGGGGDTILIFATISYFGKVSLLLRHYLPD